MLSCSYCKKPALKIVKGLCMACYTRQQRTGSVEYQRKGLSKPCTVDGCAGRAVANGLCRTHYQRMRHHGHTDQTRPANWGLKNSHPLTEQWNYLHRKKGEQLCADEWLHDFDRFVADVGERPSPDHRLKRRDLNRLIGPDNFMWVKPEFNRLPGETQRQANNRAERARRQTDPDTFRNIELRKKYAGLTLRDVAAMSDKQGHKCAICGDEGKLNVDHDHETNAIRGLLCSPCNRGLGFFRDSRERLLAAVAYLANPPGEAQPRTPIRRRKPRILETQMQTGTANNET